MKEFLKMSQLAQEIHLEKNEEENNEETRNKVLFSMKEQKKWFTGRVEVLNHIHSILQTDKDHAVAIRGLPAIGKTELIRKYVVENSTYYDENIFWINATTKNSLIDTFNRLAKDVLKIPVTKAIYGESEERLFPKNNDDKSIVKYVYKAFVNRKSLFIFDNTIDLEDIEEYLPTVLCPEIGIKSIILITCGNEWKMKKRKEDLEVIELNNFTVDEALDFVKKSLESSASNNLCTEDILKLIDELKYFPLALEQATSYIKEVQISSIKTFGIVDYLNEYKEQESKISSSKNKQNSYPFNDILLKIWNITLNKIRENDIALKIFQIMAYLSPHSIDSNVLFSSVVDSKEDLRAAIDLLCQYSMINKENGSLSIHSIVQDVVKYQLKEKGNEKDILEDAIKLLGSALNNNIIDEINESHIISLWNFASEYDELIGNLYFEYQYFTGNYTPLQLLAKTDNFESAEKILNQIKETNSNTFYDVMNASNFNSKTAVDMAIFYGHLRVLKLFIDLGAEIDTVPRLEAVFHGHVNIVNLLNPNNQQHLLYAEYISVLRFGNVDILINFMQGLKQDQLTLVKLQLEEEAESHIHHFNKSSPFHVHVAIANGYLEILKLLLSYDFDCKIGITFNTTLNYSQLEILSYLLDKYIINVNEVDEYNSPIIHNTIARGHLEIVKLMFKNGVDTKAVDTYGLNALHCAVKSGVLIIVKYLLYNNMFELNNSDNNGLRPLHYAVESNHLEIIKLLIENGADRNVVDNDGQTILHFAVKLGDLAIVKYLLSIKIEVNVHDNDGFTALHYAASNNHLEILKILIENGADKNVVNNDGCTILHLAVKSDELEIGKYIINNKLIDINIANKEGLTPIHDTSNMSMVIFLLENGADSKHVNKEGYTVLHYVAEVGDLEHTKYLVNNNIIDINCPDFEGATPLHYAVRYSQLEIIEFLMDNGADKIATDNEDRTAIYLAIDRDELDTVKYLLDNKLIDVNIQDKNCKTPLHYSAEGHLELFKFLLENGADSKALDAKFKTMLHVSVASNQLEIVKYLIDNSLCEVNKRDDCGRSSLHYAAKISLEIVELLLENDAECNVVDQNDFTILHFAIEESQIDIVKYILVNELNDVNCTSKNGITPLLKAAEKSNLEIVKLLIENGANTKAVNDNGWTILHFAISGGKIEIVKYLLNNDLIDVNVSDINGKTPLHLSMYYGQFNIVEFLLGEKIKQKINLNAMDKYGVTPIFYGLLNNNNDLVEILFKKIDVNINATIADPINFNRELNFSIGNVTENVDVEVEIVKKMIQTGGLDNNEIMT